MDELSGVADRQRLQQHGVDDGEDGGVGADADGEGQDGGRREAAVLPQQAEGEAGVLEQAFHSSLYDGPARCRFEVRLRDRRPANLSRSC